MEIMDADHGGLSCEPASRCTHHQSRKAGLYAELDVLSWQGTAAVTATPAEKVKGVGLGGGSL